MTSGATVSALAGLLDPDPPGSPVIGIEREYRVLDPELDDVDFRTLVGTLGLPGGGLDPADPNAHHLPSGVLATADGREAEIATPPVAVGPNSTWIASSWIEFAEDELLSALPIGFGVEGYSTHLNVSTRGDVVRVARRFAEHFAVGMMLLLDRPDSPGLLIRPRPGRLEVGGDFSEGEQLRVALTYAIGAARCCAENDDGGLPARPHGRVVAAKDRPGWYVDRTAFTDDLYRGGRDAVLRCGHDRITAADALAHAWELARAKLGDLDASELRAVDAVVAGDRPLPLEATSGPDGSARWVPFDSPFSRIGPRVRGTLVLDAIAVSWAAVAFRVRTPTGDGHVVVPRRWLHSFLQRLDEGALDEVLAAPVATDRRGPLVLTTASLDPLTVVPREPTVPLPWWRGRRPELLGVAAGATAVLAGRLLLR